MIIRTQTSGNHFTQWVNVDIKTEKERMLNPAAPTNEGPWVQTLPSCQPQLKPARERRTILKQCFLPPTQKLIWKNTMVYDNKSSWEISEYKERCTTTFSALKSVNPFFILNPGLKPNWNESKSSAFSTILWSWSPTTFSTTFPKKVGLRLDHCLPMTLSKYLFFCSKFLARLGAF